MKESDFVEVILTVEDQQARSKEWYSDANYSEHEVLETAQIIKRNGRNFTVREVTKEDGFSFEKSEIYPDLVIFENGEEYDDVNYLDENEEYYFFEGDDKDFIYQIAKSEFSYNKNKLSSFLSVFDDETYSPNREMTDHEMDVLL